MITINATLRDVKVNPKMIRKAGNIPAVFYGAGQPSTPISVAKKAFEKALDEAGESTIVTLKTPEGELDALIHDVELDPVIGDPIHADFYIVSKDKNLQVDVPLEFIGIAPAEKLGGIVMRVMHELRIEALPRNLPKHIVIDLARLDTMESHITVADVVLPEGVRALVSSNETIVGMTMPQEEKEESAAPIDMSAIEVEKKGKTDEEGGEESEGDAEKK